MKKIEQQKKKIIEEYKKQAGQSEKNASMRISKASALLLEKFNSEIK